MESNRDGEPFGGDNLSERVWLALTTLHRPRTPGRRVGLIVSLAALVIMWAELSTHLAVAVACEFVLTAGALLFSYGLRPWWHRGRATKAPHR